MAMKIHVGKDVTRTTFAVLFIVMLTAAVFWVLRPFLPSILWATIIVIASWPLLIRLQGMFRGKRGLATAVMTILLLLVVVVPLTLAVFAIADNAGEIVAWVRSLADLSLSSPPSWVDRIPFVGGKVAEEWKHFASLSSDERTAMLTPYVKTAVLWFTNAAGGFASLAVEFLLTLVIAAILYAHGDTAASWIVSLARRLAGTQGEEAVILAGKSIRGVALGVGVTAAVQAGIGGIGLLVTGIPATPILTAVMLMLCLAQLGPLLVLLPSVGWLYWSGKVFLGTVLLVISIIAGTVDGLLRPLLIRKGLKLPLVLIFAGVIGGLISFGFVGVFIGPVVLAVALTLLQTWVSEGSQAEPSE